MNTAAELRAGPSIVDVSHEERIELVAEGESESFQPEGIDDSWRRCLLDFHVDPRSRSVPHYTKPRRDRSLLCHRSPAVYVVLLCNSDGVATHHRGDDSKDREFKRWGIWLGGVPSERVELLQV